MYALLDITCGGDGTTNFQLPNLQGRVPLGMNQSPAGMDELSPNRVVFFLEY